VDGTLTRSRQRIEKEMRQVLVDLRKRFYIGFVGGSDLKKQEEQIGDDCLDIFDFGFPENGVSFYQGRKLVSQEGVVEKLGEELYKDFVNYALKYLAGLDIPIKRGNFIELRRSVINVSPIGRSCTQEERMSFFELDKQRQIRKKMVDDLEKNFGSKGMHFCIGGQISIDCFPKGWDKTFCLNHLKDFEEVVFFGDMTMKGGNDHEISVNERTTSVTVNGPEDTIVKIREMVEKATK